MVIISLKLMILALKMMILSLKMMILSLKMMILSLKMMILQQSGRDHGVVKGKDHYEPIGLLSAPSRSLLNKLAALACRSLTHSLTHSLTQRSINPSSVISLAIYGRMRAVPSSLVALLHHKAALARRRRRRRRRASCSTLRLNATRLPHLRNVRLLLLEALS